MKALLFAIALLNASTVLAATTVTLPSRRVAMPSGASTPAMLNLSTELAKQNIGNNDQTGRLLQVDVKLKAGPTGATVALLLGGAAVDSATTEDDREITLVLGADSDVTPAPWVLAVRGEVQIVELRVSVDGGKPTSQEPSVTDPGTVGGGGNTPPIDITPPVQAGDLVVGQRVIAVSATTDAIEQVVIARRDQNGNYTVLFQGVEYPGFIREQLAVMEGCDGSFCVGDRVVLRGGSRQVHRLWGRLPNGGWVLLSELDQSRSTIASSFLLERPPVHQPAPRERLYPGLKVYYIDQDNRGIDAMIVEAVGQRPIIRMDGQNWSLPDTSRIAVPEGCAGAFCVGQQITTQDRSGRRYRGVVVAIQNTRFVAVRFNGSNAVVGNWPVSSLAH